METGSSRSRLPQVTFETLDWEALDRLRETFLAERPNRGEPYWHSLSDLANYEFSYAQRIAWKWDAVLAELAWRGWTPPAGLWLDYGCGSGIASRRVLQHYGTAACTELRLHDRSRLATDYAEAALREQFPALAASRADPAWIQEDSPFAVLVVSHVINELDERGRRQLLRLMRRAQAVLWVEPGTYDVSRTVIDCREQLLRHYDVIAPCTHQAACGLLAKENARHWCHYFADSPANIMADSEWVRFANRAGINLRSVPYSFLVLTRRHEPGTPDKTPAPPAALSVAGCARVIARPRLFKGFVRVLSCQAEGVCSYELQRRDDAALCEELEEGGSVPVYRWELDGTWIRTGHRPQAGAGDPAPA